MLEHSYSSARVPKRVVVLGERGFLASSLINRIASEINTLSIGSSTLDLIEVDAGEKLRRFLRHDDVLVFGAAKAPCKDTNMLLQNICMLNSVCHALRHQNVAHVIYISSDAVYKDSDEPLKESSCAEPASIHGAMHLAREVALRHEFSDILAIVRPTLIYGVNDPHNGYGPNRFSRLAASGQDIRLFGEGEERRDHVDVGDVAELIRLIILFGSKGIVNANSGDLVSFRELAEFSAACFSPKVAVIYSPRQGPMPHNGFRPIDNQVALDSFPGFRFMSWREGLEKMNAQRKLELGK